MSFAVRPGSIVRRVGRRRRDPPRLRRIRGGGRAQQGGRPALRDGGRVSRSRGSLLHHGVVCAVDRLRRRGDRLGGARAPWSRHASGARPASRTVAPARRSRSTRRSSRRACTAASGRPSSPPVSGRRGAPGPGGCGRGRPWRPSSSCPYRWPDSWLTGCARGPAFFTYVSSQRSISQSMWSSDSRAA